MKPIKINDKDAINKLNEKLVNLINEQEMMKDRNAYYRKHGTMKGFFDWSDEKAAKVDATIASAPSWQEKAPYRNYLLVNNSAEIRRTKKRIEELSKIQNNEGLEYATDGLGFRVEENKNLMRIQIFFDTKPEADTRTYLKQNGFKWAPSQDAWQRHLNEGGRWAIKRFIEKQRAGGEKCTEQ